MIRLGLCLPKTCTKPHLEPLVRNYINSNTLKALDLYNVSLELHQADLLEESGYYLLEKPFTILLLITVSLMTLLTITGTILSRLKHINSQELDGRQKGTPLVSGLKNALCCFSLPDNLASIARVKDDGDNPLGCIHGLRFVCMFWIVTAHTTIYMADFADNDPVAFRYLFIYTLLYIQEKNLFLFHRI